MWNCKDYKYLIIYTTRYIKKNHHWTPVIFGLSVTTALKTDMDITICVQEHFQKSLSPQMEVKALSRKQEAWAETHLKCTEAKWKTVLWSENTQDPLD